MARRLPRYTMILNRRRRRRLVEIQIPTIPIPVDMLVPGSMMFFGFF